MATLKMGALATSIRGSIGGTTFRRQGSNIIVYNKPKGASYSKALNAGNTPRLVQGFNAWSSLSSQQKNDWNTQAQKFFYTDNWGNQVPYTGRGLFVSTWNTAKHFDAAPPDPLQISGTVPQPTQFAVSWLNNTTGIEFEIDEPINKHKALISFDLVRDLDSKPIFKRRKIQMVLPEVNPPDVIQVQNFFANYFGGPQYGLNLRFYYTPVNDYFMRGIPLASNFKW